MSDEPMMDDERLRMAYSGGCAVAAHGTGKPAANFHVDGLRAVWNDAVALCRRASEGSAPQEAVAPYAYSVEADGGKLREGTYFAIDYANGAPQAEINAEQEVEHMKREAPEYDWHTVPLYLSSSPSVARTTQEGK